MAQLFKSFIPVEFLDAWTRGQYVIGRRTLDYQYAGLALMLQGFYRYDVRWDGSQDGNREQCFGGYAVAYIQDYELNFAGFRMYNTKSGERTPLFWQSVFSRFVDGPAGNAELYFPYRILAEQQITDDKDSSKLSSSEESSYSDQNGLDDAENDIVNFNSDHFSCRHLDIYRIIANLSISRAAARADEKTEETRLRGLCMLRPPSAPSLRKQRRDPKWDLVLEGQNYGVVVGQPIEGTVVFKRLSRQFLDMIERAHARHGDGGKQ